MIILVFLCVKKMGNEQSEYFENIEQIQNQLQIVLSLKMPIWQCLVG